MKTFLIAALATFAFGASAFAKKTVTSAYSSNESSFGIHKFVNQEGTQNFSGGLGFFGTDNMHMYQDSNSNGGTIPPLSGLFAIAVDYEYMWKEDFGVGAFFHYYSTSDDRNDGVTVNDSFTEWVLAPIARFHFPNNFFDFYFGVGFGLGQPYAESKTSASKIKYDPGVGLEPLYQLGIQFALNREMAVGVETNHLLALGSSLNGWILNDYLLKFRYTVF